ncbi:transposase [Thalassoporum mexicanum]|nr:transposase [Pseudanabaena sp. PCC 7367]
MTKKGHRLFTAEQKAEAVAIVNSPDKPISQVARDLGMECQC